MNSFTEIIEFLSKQETTELFARVMGFLWAINGKIFIFPLVAVANGVFFALLMSIFANFFWYLSPGFATPLLPLALIASALYRIFLLIKTKGNPKSTCSIELEFDSDDSARVALNRPDFD